MLASQVRSPFMMIEAIRMPARTNHGPVSGRGGWEVAEVSPRFRQASVSPSSPECPPGRWKRDQARKWPHTSDESHPVSVEDRGQFRTPPKLAPGASRQLRYGAVVDCQVVLAVQSRLVPDAVGAIGMLVERQARPLTEPMRRGPQRIRRQSQRKDCAGSQVNNMAQVALFMKTSYPGRR